MSQSTRRKFIIDTGKASIAAGFITLAGNPERTMVEKNLFIHHVYFWLKNPDSKEDLKKLRAGLEKLSKIDYIKMFHIGKPADTNRDVIDRSYSASWLLLFKNKDDEERYQKDPIHLKFVEECKDLWQKVVVYDSIDAL